MARLPIRRLTDAKLSTGKNWKIMDGAELLATVAAMATPAKLLYKFLEPTIVAAGEGVAVPVQSWRDRRVLRAKKVLEESAKEAALDGGAIHAVPGRLLFPVLERASVEEDEGLFDRWTALLANAALDPDSVLPAFAGILGELSPSEVRLLASMAEGDADLLVLANRHHKTLDLVKLVKDVSDLRLLVANLDRMQLVIPSLHASAWDTIGDEQLLGHEYVRITRFGAKFILACSRRRKEQ